MRLTPDSVKTLVSEGHEVLVENNGGYEAGFENKQYQDAGIGGLPSDIANAVVYLSSHLGQYVNGETLLVDGGMIASQKIHE